MIRIELFNGWYELRGKKWFGERMDVLQLVQSVSDIEDLNLGYAPDPEVALAVAVASRLRASNIELKDHQAPIEPEPPLDGSITVF